MRLLRSMPFVAASFSHIVVEPLIGLTPMLVVAFSVPFGRNNAMVGLLTSLYGLAGALFQPLFGAAVGGVVGRFLADRFGKCRVIQGTTALSIVPLYLLPLISGALLAILIAATGLLNVAPHSIPLTMAQNTLPGGGGLAPGLLMGSMFTLGGVGILVTGFAADRIGLMQVLRANVLVCMAALGAGVWLWTIERKRLRTLTVKPRAWPLKQEPGADR